MYDLNETDKLLLSKTYELRRKDGAIRIEVLEHMTANDPKFIVIPCLNVSDAPKEYFGFGSDEESAMQDCFKKIKTKSLIDLFPHMKRK